MAMSREISVLGITVRSTKYAVFQNAEWNSLCVRILT
jgi:hypothetical protein